MNGAKTAINRSKLLNKSRLAEPPGKALLGIICYTDPINAVAALGE
jgi:hypothetical protein